LVSDAFSMPSCDTFFLTLNFNHKVLYAPSDFSDEINFMNLFGRATPLQKEQSINKEAQEIVRDEKSAVHDTNKIASTMNRIDIRSRALLAEQFALSRIQEEFGEKVHSNPTVTKDYGGGSYILDGLIQEKDQAIGIEVKYLRQATNAARRAREASSAGMSFFDNLTPEYKKRYKCKLIVALVCETKQVQEAVKKSIPATTQRLKDREVLVEYRVYNLEDSDYPNNGIE